MCTEERTEGIHRHHPRREVEIGQICWCLIKRKVERSEENTTKFFMPFYVGGEGVEWQQRRWRQRIVLPEPSELKVLTIRILASLITVEMEVTIVEEEEREGGERHHHRETMWQNTASMLLRSAAR